jgi:hypothetical protein
MQRIEADLDHGEDEEGLSCTVLTLRSATQMRRRRRTACRRRHVESKVGTAETEMDDG